MFDRVTLRASDRDASERFYGLLLATLDIAPSHSTQDAIRWDDLAIVCAAADHPPTRHLHVGFVAPSREHVDAFWRAGIDAGYRDDGPPGVRAQYRPEYYGAFLLDPDGNSAEAVHHADTRRGGHIDHLWMRVRDPGASEAFYKLVARYTGLREGRRWDTGVQFRGAWATFSLVHDELPLTENVHMAFPAPDRETVQEFHRAASAAGGGAPVSPRSVDATVYAATVYDPDGFEVESVFRERAWA